MVRQALLPADDSKTDYPGHNPITQHQVDPGQNGVGAMACVLCPHQPQPDQYHQPDQAGAACGKQ